MANLNDGDYYNDDDKDTSELGNEVTVVSDETISINLTTESLSLIDLSEQAADSLVGTDVEATENYSQENVLMPLQESNKMTKSLAIPTSNEKLFHAGPVPKSTYKMNASCELDQPVAKNTTNKNRPTSQKSLQKESRKPTTSKPFSFEEREKMKEDRQKKNLGQKSKMIETREFHARPAPKSVLNPSTKVTVKNIVKKSDKEELNTETRFKAKPATVLYKKPFEPKIEHRPILETDSFILNTELRSKDRENFEQYLKKREEKIKSLIQQEEELNKKKEEEEFLIARKKAEFKASNIKKYKEVVIEPIQKVTIPVTPQLLKRKAKTNFVGKENVSYH